MNCIKRECGYSNARYLFIRDENVEKFSQNKTFYANQLKKQLMANILQDGQWGSFRHLSIDFENDASLRQVEHAYITTMFTGYLSSFKWIESSIGYKDPTDQNELCFVYYSALNFR